jgi:hypothetical protein
MLGACEVEALTEARAKQVGRLLALSRSTDVVDAAVVVGAAERRDTILTSDPEDIERLVQALGRSVAIILV